MTRTLVAPTLLVLLTSACIPNRDNPEDPALKPKIVLTVPFTIGSPGTPFVFDASESTDPQGHPLTFHWELHDEELDGLDDDDYDLSTGTNGELTTTLTIPADRLDSLGEGNVQRVVKLEVRARSGATAYAQSPAIFVENEAPVVDAGDDLFVSPTWEGEVILDACGASVIACSSYDEDPEDLEFEWEPLLVDADIQIVDDLDANHRRIRLLVSGEHHRSQLFRLTGRDAVTSRSKTLRVHFTPQAWVATTNPTRVYRVDPTFRRTSALIGTAGTVELALPRVMELSPDGMDLWVGERTAIPDNALYRLDRDFNVLQTWNPPGSALTWISPRDDGSSWFTMGNAAGIALADGSTVFTAISSARRIFDRGDGTAWHVARNTVRVIDESASVTVIASGLLDVTGSGLASDGSLWIAEAFVDGNVLRSRLTRFLPDFSVEGPFELPGERFVQEIVPRPEPGRMWVHDAISRTFLDVAPDFTYREIGGPLTRLTAVAGNPRQTWPDPDVPGIWVSDSQAGALVYLFDTGTEAFEVGRVAIEDVVPGASGWLTPVLDPVSQQVLAMAAPADAPGEIVTLPQSLRTLADVPFPFEAAKIQGIGPDRARGAAWIGDSATSSQHLRRLSDGGRELVSLAGDATSLVSLGDGHVWTLSYDGYIRFFDPEGELLVQYGPLEANTAFVGFAIDETTQTACATSTPDLGFTGRVHRIDLLTGSTTAMPAVDTPSEGCAVTPDGAVWFSHAPDVENCFSTPSELLRYGPGSTAPTEVFTSEFGNPFQGCPAPPVVRDPRDASVWYVDDVNQRATRFDVNGEVENIPALLDLNTSIFEVVDCLDGTADCVELWYGTFGGHEVTRLRDDGTVLSRLRVPTGEPVVIEVVK